MILLDPTTLDRLSNRPRPDGGDPLRQLDRNARFLSEQDRLLVQMALKLRLSRRQVGMALGISPGNVSRRLRRLVNRLHDPLICALCDPKCPLNDEYRQIGLAHFLHDQPARELARARRVSEVHVRGMIEYIRGWHRGLTARR